METESYVQEKAGQKRPHVKKTVGVVLEEDSESSFCGANPPPPPPHSSRCENSSLSPQLVTTTTTTSVHQIPIEKLDWQNHLSIPATYDVDENGNTKVLTPSVFDQYVKLTTFNPKHEACFINFDRYTYMRNTGFNFSNKATKNGLTIETPWLKVMFGLKSSADYPDSYSMRLSLEENGMDNTVTDFRRFLEDVVDASFREQIIGKAYSWMKDDPKYNRHCIVQKHRDNKNEKIFQSAWNSNQYTSEMYRADISECYVSSIKTTTDGGMAGLHLKVYPRKTSEGSSVPDIFIFDKNNNQITYEECPMLKEPGKGFVKALISINRISFTKEKFYATWVCPVMKFIPLTEMEPETGGKTEITYTFDGSNAPVVFTPSISTKTSHGTHEE